MYMWAQLSASVVLLLKGTKELKVGRQRSDSYSSREAASFMRHGKRPQRKILFNANVRWSLSESCLFALPLFVYCILVKTSSFGSPSATESADEQKSNMEQCAWKNFWTVHTHSTEWCFFLLTTLHVLCLKREKKQPETIYAFVFHKECHSVQSIGWSTQF